MNNNSNSTTTTTSPLQPKNYSTSPSPFAERLKARRLSLFDPPKTSSGNAKNNNNNSNLGESDSPSRLTIRRSSFHERAPTPVPPFVAPDVDVPKDMLKQQLKKYSYLPSNITTDEKQQRPPTPIPSDEAMKNKKQVFHMLNRNMEELYEQQERDRIHQRMLDGSDLTPQERNSIIAESLSKQTGVPLTLLRRHSAPRLDFKQRNLQQISIDPKK